MQGRKRGPERFLELTRYALATITKNKCCKFLKCVDFLIEITPGIVEVAKSRQGENNSFISGKNVGPALTGKWVNEMKHILSDEKRTIFRAELPQSGRTDAYCDGCNKKSSQASSVMHGRSATILHCHL